MSENLTTFTFVAPGTMAANATYCVKLPFAFMPRHISATASNDSAALLKVGTVADDDGLLASTVIGDSNAPSTFTPSSFVDPDYQYARGDVMLLSVDYDGAAGTAAQNLTITVTGLIGA